MLSSGRALVMVWVVLALVGCSVRQSILCTLTDVEKDLHSTQTEVLGNALQCALRQSPQQLTENVPALLAHLRNVAVYKTVQYGGGLIGFGEAGPRQIVIAQMAARALETASPIEANIEPIVGELVKALNEMPEDDYSGEYGAPSTIAATLVQILKSYHASGLSSAIARNMQQQLPNVRNKKLDPQGLYLPDLRALAEGLVRDPYAEQTLKSESP